MAASDPATTISDFSTQAVSYVQRALGVELAYDSETLPLLDHYLATVPRDQPETLALIARATGAYFGEVVIRHIGGRWDPTGDVADWRVVLPLGVSFSPTAVVLASILREDADDAELHIPAVLQSFAEDALARMGEVTEDEYYSLCGRLDTLEHLHAVLVAVAAEHSHKQDGDPN